MQVPDKFVALDTQGKKDRADRPQGYGKASYLDHHTCKTYEGEFRQGRAGSQGRITYHNGNVFVGELKDGQPSCGEMLYQVPPLANRHTRPPRDAPSSSVKVPPQNGSSNFAFCIFRPFYRSSHAQAGNPPR